MISVFARNYGPIAICDPDNFYAASFDGQDDYAHVVGIGSIKPVQNFFWSYWIKLNNTTSDGNLRWHFGQSISGNNQEDFIRILYQAATGNNRLEFNYRTSGTANQMTTYWYLHGSNSTITGSTSSTDYWNASNSNINVNANGYVHLAFSYIGNAYGQSSSSTSVNCYWNGQLMTSSPGPTSGTIVNNGVATNRWGLGVNPYNYSLSNVPNAYIDSMFIIPDMTVFKSVNGLSAQNEAQVVQVLYNNGCPWGGAAVDARWMEFEFEQSWADTAGYGVTWTPVNGATFTTNHA